MDDENAHVKGNTLSESRHRTEGRFNRRNDPNKHEFCFTALGKAAARPFLEALTKSFAVEREFSRPLPMRFELGKILAELRPEELAFIALPPLLDGIMRNWDGHDGPSATMLLKERMGTYLYQYLALEVRRREGLTEKKIRGADWWTAWKLLQHGEDREQVVRAGHWLMEWCTTCLNCFTKGDKDTPPEIKVECRIEVDRLRERLMYLDPVIMPHVLSPPPDWVGLRTQYDDRLGANFTSDWRPESKQAVSDAFKNWLIREHADAVNSLQHVPFVVDHVMANLAEKHGADLIGHKGAQYERDQRMVCKDVEDARWLGHRRFYLSWRCDKRGRIYGIPYFNYGREDHVRAMFRFANGMPLGDDGIKWLEINCANCGGFEGVDKKPFADRIDWAKRHENLIQRIAKNPDGTIDEWRDADRPFAFVAACRGLASAWASPRHFVTHLPVEFDGSANGIQHLALLARDKDAARRVNLIWSEAPRDVYQDIAALVIERLQADGHKSARWWCDKFDRLHNQPKNIRKLIKVPAMTFAYNSTIDGMATNIAKVYREIEMFEGLEPRDNVARYLAKIIRAACAEIMPEPAKVMEYICGVTDGCTANGRIVEWISPSGFPVRNAYHKPKVDRNGKVPRLNLLRADGTRLRHTVQLAVTRKINSRKARDSAPANFIHSQDAAHLVRVVNAAVAAGVSNIVTVHDAFACLASQATRLNQIIRERLAAMYMDIPGKELYLLRSYNAQTADNLPMPPAPGLLDSSTVWSSPWSWS